MLKNWKSLFVKSDEVEPQEPVKETKKQDFSFPVSNPSTSGGTYMPNNVQVSTAPTATAAPGFQNEAVNEVIGVYEKGLDSINMPGYDFYEFYKAVSTAGHPSEQMYNMAFQMAKTMDGTISVQKLLQDAEFYISKINEVHSNYNSQGQNKLGSINAEKSNQKAKLSSEVDQITAKLTELRAEIQRLDAEVLQKRDVLAKIDGNYLAEENNVRSTLAANDIAKQTSIDKLNRVKDSIRNFIK
jgi:DNA-binding transcriptional MerR regulator